MTQHVRTAFRLSISVFALAVSVSFARTAAASDTYPAAVQEARGMPCAPPCTLCHDTLSGGLGTANRPFGQAIRGTGQLSCCSPGTVRGALEAMLADGCTTASGFTPGRCNSDGDDLSDIEELDQGRDPNVPGAGNLCGGPTYGCGARVAGGSAEFDWFSLLMAGAVAVTLIHSARRMRRRA